MQDFILGLVQGFVSFEVNAWRENMVAEIQRIVDTPIMRKGNDSSWRSMIS